MAIKPKRSTQKWRPISTTAEGLVEKDDDFPGAGLGDMVAEINPIWAEIEPTNVELFPRGSSEPAPDVVLGAFFGLALSCSQTS